MKNSQEQPLVSIIVPVYNVEKYLDRCVESILGQDYRNIEVLLIDDGSTDNSGDICDKYSVDIRVKVIHQKNGGLSRARNTGLKNITGEYVAFVDSDDYISSQFISHALNQILVDKLDFIVFGYWEIRGGKLCEPAYKKDNMIHESLSAESINIRNLLIADKIPNYACNKLYKSELWNGVRFPEGRTYEDMHAIARLLERNPKIGYLAENLYYYNRDNPSSITSPLGKLNSRFRYDRFKSVKERISLVNNLNLSNVIKRELLFSCMDEAIEIILLNAGKHDLTEEEEIEVVDFIEKERRNPLLPQSYMGTKRCILVWGITYLPSIVKFYGKQRYKRKMDKLMTKS